MTYLATGDETPEKRLESVALDHLCHIKPDVDLPKECRQEFIKIMNRLNKAWGKPEEVGTLARGVRTMSDDEVSSTIENLVYLYGRLCEEIGRGR